MKLLQSTNYFQIFCIEADVEKLLKDPEPSAEDLLTHVAS